MKRAVACCVAVLLAVVLTVRAAGAMITAEEYGWYDGYAESAGGGGGQPKCGTSGSVVCSITTSRVCVEWEPYPPTFGAQCRTLIPTVVVRYYP